MVAIFDLIQVQKNTFQEFRKWLFLYLNKNEQSFRNFGTYPNKLKIPYLLEFLESKNIPILEALSYYNALSSNQAINFEELCLYMIKEEFSNLENKRIINYTPF